MPAPTLNFVWIGPPKFHQGGQDVIGPELLNKNFKTVPRPEGTEINPMTFWCQEEYKKLYVDYFASKGMDIRVSSIDAYLETSTHLKAAQVQKYYQTLTSHKPNPPLNCVYAKDMLFNFILATQGGYVLDTTIYPMDDKPVLFPAYTKFKYPMIESTTSRDQADCWMQYSPLDLTRANKSLNWYLDKLSRAAIFNPASEESKKHKELGILGVGAATLNDDSEPDDFSVWTCSPRKIMDTRLEELSIIKEYTNSHLMNREHTYSKEHLHIFTGAIDRLEFYLSHGGDVNLSASPSMAVEKIPFDAQYETLLIFAMKYCQEKHFIACAKLLLKYGADPNKQSTVSFPRSPSYQYTALTYAIINSSEEGLKLLLEDTKIPINMHQINNGYSILELAFAYKCSPSLLEMLLKNGADPNLKGNLSSPSLLKEAVNRQNREVVTLLLNYGADPSTVTLPPEGSILNPCQELVHQAKIKGREPGEEEISSPSGPRF